MLCHISRNSGYHVRVNLQIPGRGLKNTVFPRVSEIMRKVIVLGVQQAAKSTVIMLGSGVNWDPSPVPFPSHTCVLCLL